MKHHVLVFLLWFTFANITRIQANTFEQWQAENFSAAELADPAISGVAANPAGDGLSNLLKYAFDLDPHTPGMEGTPQPSFFAGHLALNFFHRSAANDLLYALEASPDLVHWSIRNSLQPSAQVYLGAVAQWTVADGVWDLFAVTGEDTIFYSDPTAQSGTAYNYRIRALFPSNPVFPGGHSSAWTESGAVTPVSSGGGSNTPDPDPDTDSDTFKD